MAEVIIRDNQRPAIHKSAVGHHLFKSFGQYIRRQQLAIADNAVARSIGHFSEQKTTFQQGFQGV
jgi:hypothetical protein